MNCKVRIGREIQRKDFLQDRIFVIGLDRQRAVEEFDRGRDVSLASVAGP